MWLQRLLAHGDSVPANGNGAAASNGADVWRSDGSAGTLFGAEARLALLWEALCCLSTDEEPPTASACAAYAFPAALLGWKGRGPLPVECPLAAVASGAMHGALHPLR